MPQLAQTVSEFVGPLLPFLLDQGRQAGKAFVSSATWVLSWASCSLSAASSASRSASAASRSASAASNSATRGSTGRSSSVLSGATSIFDHDQSGRSIPGRVWLRTAASSGGERLHLIWHGSFRGSPAL